MKNLKNLNKKFCEFPPGRIKKQILLSQKKIKTNSEYYQ